MNSQLGDRLTTGFENGSMVRAYNFDYASLDGDDPEPVDSDAEFWRTQAELLQDVLRWVTEPKTADGVGARLCALCSYLCPPLVPAYVQNESMREELNKFLVRTQQKFPATPEYYRKIESLQRKLPGIRERAKRGWQAGRRRINSACRGS